MGTLWREQKRSLFVFFSFFFFLFELKKKLYFIPVCVVAESGGGGWGDGGSDWRGGPLSATEPFTILTIDTLPAPTWNTDLLLSIGIF